MGKVFKCAVLFLFIHVFYLSQVERYQCQWLGWCSHISQQIQSEAIQRRKSSYVCPCKECYSITNVNTIPLRMRVKQSQNLSFIMTYFTTSLIPLYIFSHVRYNSKISALRLKPHYDEGNRGKRDYYIHVLVISCTMKNRSLEHCTVVKI